MLRKRRHTTEEFPKTTGPWEISSRWPDSKTDPTPFIAGEDDFYSEAALENPMMPKFLPDSDDLQTSINPFPAEIGAVEGEDPESDTSSGSGQSFSLVSTPAPGNAAWGGDGVTWDGNASLDDCGHMPYASHMRMSEFRQVQASFDWEILSRAIVTTLYPHWPQAQARQQIDLLYYLRHIGQGGSSSVYAAAFEGFGLDDTLAVKILEDCKQKTPTGLPREFQIMQSLKHDHIVAFVGSFAQEDKFGVLMYPLAPYNLAQYLQETSDYHTEHGRPHQPRVKTLLTALGCLSSALLYLHVTQNIKHKDIKPQNILVDRHGSVLLADFGISKQYQSETVTSGPTPFTEEYAAPEVAAQGNRDLSADIFSLGCVFLEMATVILSESLKSLHREVFDGSSGSPHPKQAYHHSLPKVERWICHLKEISCREGRSYFSPSDSERTTGKPFLQEQHLDMILVMMSDSPDKRPSIRDLYQLFKEFAVDCSDCHSRTNASSVQAKEVIEQCGTGNASGAKIITNRLQASELTYNSAHQTVGQSDIASPNHQFSHTGLAPSSCAVNQYNRLSAVKASDNLQPVSDKHEQDDDSSEAETYYSDSEISDDEDLVADSVSDDLAARVKSLVFRFLESEHSAGLFNYCGSGEPTTSRQAGSASNGPPSKKRSIGQGKSVPIPQDDDPDDDGDEPDERRGQNIEEKSNVPRKWFACQFFQRNPSRCTNRSCSGPGWPALHRLKEHLMRTHRIFRCARCQEIFRKSNDLNIHLRQVTSCQLRDKNPDEEHDWGQGFDEDQANKLKTRIRKMQQRETGDEQKWREWYKILFPNDTAIPSPYYNQVNSLIPDLMEHLSTRMSPLFSEDQWLRCESLIRESLEEFRLRRLETSSAQYCDSPGNPAPSIAQSIMGQQSTFPTPMLQNAPHDPTRVQGGVFAPSQHLTDSSLGNGMLQLNRVQHSGHGGGNETIDSACYPTSDPTNVLAHSETGLPGDKPVATNDFVDPKATLLPPDQGFETLDWLHGDGEGMWWNPVAGTETELEPQSYPSPD